ncbi:Imm74 family immunity protein [Pseudomonas crudilactis]|uniref:Imm74 family immunity protein n=1 Tax=Pseudomonas crudilactis TaxID=2697028 RepID=UPI0012FDDC68
MAFVSHSGSRSCSLQQNWDVPNENQALTEEEVQRVIDEVEVELSRTGHMLDVEK